MTTTKRGPNTLRIAAARTTRRRFLRHAGVAAGSALAMPWIARGVRADAAPPPLNRDPNTLVVAVDAAIDNLDPATNNSWAFGLAPLYDTLTKLKGTSLNQTVPALAERFEAGDNFGSWTCTLRKGVKFPDGTVCDAAAVKANIVRTVTLPIGQGYVWNLNDPEKQITVVDGSTLRFDFGAEPRPYFNLECAAQYGFWIADAAAAAAHSKGPDDGGSEWLQANPQGSGPYRLESLDPGHEAVFVKNPEYWGGWQGKHFDRVIARTVPLAGTRRQLLEEGEADLIWPGTPEDTVALAQDPRFAVTDAKTCTMEFIRLGNYGPLKDPRARQALNYAFDNAGYIRDVTRNTQSRPRGVFPGQMATADANVASIPFDLGKAHELFEAAGVTRGTELTIEFFEGFGNEAAGLLQAWLAELGISLKLQEKSYSAFIESYFSDAPGEERPNMYFFSWWPNWDHPYSFAWVLFHKAAWGATGGNAGLYDNAEANKLIDAMRDAPVDDKLKAMSQRLQRILTVEDPAWIPVAEERTHLVHRTDLRGLELNPLYVLTLDMYALSREA
jgi:peptide/nickel transport system substrate-binding protein